MSPKLSAELHRQGLLADTEALWYYDSQGEVVPNNKAMFDEDTGEPKF